MQEAQQKNVFYTIKQTIGSVKKLLVKIGISLKKSWLSIINSIKFCKITLSFFAIGALLSYFSVQLSNNNSILTSIATIIGTVLALTFTLSIISIQTASAIGSDTILNIYQEDKKISRAYFLFAFLTLATLLLAISDMPHKNISFIFLAFTFDILSWYYHYICQLLNPHKAVNMLCSEAIKQSNNYEKLARRSTIGNFDLTRFYQKGKEFPSDIRRNMNELSCICFKAISRSDILLIEATLDAINKIIFSYLLIRKSTLLIDEDKANFLENEPVAYALLDDARWLIYHNFKAAFSMENENICKCIMTRYYDASIFLAALTSNSHLLIKYFLGFLEVCVNHTFEKKWIDTPYEMTKYLFELISKILQYTKVDTSYLGAIQLIHYIASYFISTNKSHLTEKIAENLFRILNYMLFKADPRLIETLDFISQYFIKWVDQHITLDINLVRQQFAKISGIYSDEYLKLIKELKFISNDIKRFLDVSKVTFKHFNDLAKFDLGSNQSLSRLIINVEFIIKTLIELLGIEEQTSKELLIKEIKSYATIFCTILENKSSINRQNLQTVGKALSNSAVLLFQAKGDATSLLIFFSKKIYNLICYYCHSNEIIEQEIISLLLSIWEVRKAAEKTNLTIVIENLDKMIEKKPPSLNDDVWKKCLMQFEKEKTPYALT